MSHIVEVDAATGQVVERPMTPQEATQREIDATQVAAFAAAEAERQALVASARQKVAESSGLTPEEMAALGF